MAVFEGNPIIVNVGDTVQVSVPLDYNNPYNIFFHVDMQETDKWEHTFTPDIDMVGAPVFTVYFHRLKHQVVVEDIVVDLSLNF